MDVVAWVGIVMLAWFAWESFWSGSHEVAILAGVAAGVLTWGAL